MATFRTDTKTAQESSSFERLLQAQGYRERAGATSSTLHPREYFKRYGSSDPNSFDGAVTVTFEVRES